MDIPTITRSLLYGKDNLEAIRKFEAERGLPLREIPLGSMVRWNRSSKKVEAVGVDPSLIAQKVIDTVVSGADYVPLWNKISRVTQMTAQKEEVPIMTYTDFKIRKGVTGSRVSTAGGFASGVELDCSNEKGLRRVEVSLRKTWIRDNKWGALEEALRDAGYAMYDEVLGTIITELEADVNSTFTDGVANWGNDHYKSLVKMVSLIAGKRLYPDMVLIHPDELYDILILDYFVHANYSGLAAKGSIRKESGLAGFLFPNNVPIYYTPKVTAAKMICLSSQKAAYLGVMQDLTVEDFNDVLGGKEGSVLTMQWDVKSGKDATPTSNVLYAWAIATSA